MSVDGQNRYNRIKEVYERSVAYDAECVSTLRAFRDQIVALFPWDVSHCFYTTSAMASDERQIEDYIFYARSDGSARARLVLGIGEFAIDLDVATAWNQKLGNWAIRLSEPDSEATNGATVLDETVDMNDPATLNAILDKLADTLVAHIQRIRYVPKPTDSGEQ